MAQTATAWSTEHALNIHESNSGTLTVHAIKTELADLEARRAHLDNTVFYAGTFFRATSQLKYGDKLKVSFVITEEHLKDFVLIKGNLEFHRSAHMLISYNRSEGTFDVTTGWQHGQELYKFLGKISTWVDQELSFKRQLKQMMAFEREYRAKLAKVYAGGDGFTLLRAA